MLTRKEFLKKFDALENLMMGFAMKLTRNREEAKDLMQEVLYRSFKNRASYTVGTNFKSWISTIMRNTYINNYRKKRTRNQVMQPVEDMMFAIDSRTTTGGTQGRIMLKEIHGMINDLSDAYREPFKLFVQGFQYQEIAQEFDIPMGTVKSRINYARKKLKTAIITNYGSAVRRA